MFSQMNIPNINIEVILLSKTAKVNCRTVIKEQYSSLQHSYLGNKINN